MREMKDSGVEWIGEIPASWSIIRTKFLFNVLSGATPESTKAENWDGEIRWITPADYKTNDVYISCGRRNLSQVGFESCSTNMIPAGSIIFSKRAPIGSVAINSVDLCTNQGCLSCVSKGEGLVKYYYYVMSVSTEQYELLGSGTTFKEISAQNFSNFNLPCPQYEDQVAISKYLDIKCSQVDTLITNVQAQIEKLKAYKQSLITEIVTKGLDPTVPMKDSGVEWIGTIPEHWGTAKLQYCAQIRSGITLGKKYPKGTKMIERPYLRVANVQSGGVLLDNVKTVEVSADDDLQYRLSVGEVLMTEGGDRDKLGRGCVWEGQIAPCLHQNHIFALQTNDLLDPQFLAYMTVSDVGRVYFDITAIKTTNLACTNSSKVLAFRFPLPKMDEQIELAAYLDKRCAQIDRLISIKQTKIEKLEQYKRSLIYEFVTGKKEVC